MPKGAGMTENPGNVEILIIEDDREMTWLLTDLFEAAGYRVRAASDGLHALHLVQKHLPDLIVLDLMMPRMDGWETCRHIRKCSDVPIIVVSGRDDESDIVRALDLGADDYITKP